MSGCGCAPVLLMMLFMSVPLSFYGPERQDAARFVGLSIQMIPCCTNIIIRCTIDL